jgi:endonuclease III
MNKYNYNILISIITSQQYNIENTRLEELLELFRSLNQLEKSGEILYDELTRYLKHYLEAGQQLKLT